MGSVSHPSPPKFTHLLIGNGCHTPTLGMLDKCVLEFQGSDTHLFSMWPREKGVYLRYIVFSSRLWTVDIEHLWKPGLRLIRHKHELRLHRWNVGLHQGCLLPLSARHNVFFTGPGKHQGKGAAWPGPPELVGRHVIHKQFACVSGHCSVFPLIIRSFCPPRSLPRIIQYLLYL